MLRRILIAVWTLVLTLSAAAGAAPNELSVTDRLDDRRYVASGTRGYMVGVESGDFPARTFGSGSAATPTSRPARPGHAT